MGAVMEIRPARQARIRQTQSWCCVLDRSETLRRGIWQRPNQDRIDQCEDGGDASASERKRDHDDQGNTGTLHQRASRMAKVASDTSEPGPAGGRRLDES